MEQKKCRLDIDIGARQWLSPPASPHLYLPNSITRSYYFNLLPLLELCSLLRRRLLLLLLLLLRRPLLSPPFLLVVGTPARYKRRRLRHARTPRRPLPFATRTGVRTPLALKAPSKNESCFLPEAPLSSKLVYCGSLQEAWRIRKITLPLQKTLNCAQIPHFNQCGKSKNEVEVFLL